MFGYHYLPILINFRLSQLQLDAAPVGGSNQTLVVTAQGKRIKVEDYVVSEQQVSAKVMYAAVQALVPRDIWERLKARRQQYMQEQRHR
ncbi:MAG: hypothetical protein Q8O28_04380 [Smithellaceae bacterium]|nr:hypothetical protein [Smithellaceae bacterium]